MIKILCFHCRGNRFRELRSRIPCSSEKRKTNKVAPPVKQPVRESLYSTAWAHTSLFLNHIRAFLASEPNSVSFYWHKRHWAEGSLLGINSGLVGNSQNNIIPYQRHIGLEKLMINDRSTTLLSLETCRKISIELGIKKKKLGSLPLPSVQGFSASALLTSCAYNTLMWRVVLCLVILGSIPHLNHQKHFLSVVTTRNVSRHC